ncbi:hypothetical protein D9V87_03745 [Bacteroidetes/Chlorobi group bacterium MS-B_bin-24]|jgi:predicted solute-binding protein|nr:MAG: hypothetical protein D9V87_03745 [Bacteroidetes/Chlorobi group bacterium MS-B_bin-24]
MIRLAFPDNPVYKPLFEGSEKYCLGNEVRCYRLSETQCSDYMLRNLVDAAFLSPLGYGKGVKVADYRIIPGPMMVSENYTGLATIYFKQGLENVNTIYSPTPDDFMMLLGQLVLNEKFGIDAKIKKMTGSKSDILLNYDSAIIWGKAESGDISLDVSEEWFDLVEEPLPLGFWVCRAESYPPKIQEIVSSFASAQLAKTEEILDSSSKYSERKGKIYWHWEPELEGAFESVLLFLYLHQMLSELPAVKILARD